MARKETVQRILNEKGYDASDPFNYQKMYARVYGPGRRRSTEFEARKLYALQGLGDREPLTQSARFGLTERDCLLHGAKVLDHAEPPDPYTKLLARKVAEGTTWPASPDTSAAGSLALTKKRHEDNLSGSSKRFSLQVEYYLRRNLKSIPAHIGEHIDFTQLIISDVQASRRSKQLYIFWSTVDREARYEIEPFLTQLSQWVIKTIRRRIPVRPNIPRVYWIYDGGELQTEVPRKVVKEMEATSEATFASLEERIDFLKNLDSLSERMKGIPWYMPYLWAKDKRGRQLKQMSEDLDSVQKRDKEKQQQQQQKKAPEPERPRYVP